MNITLFMGEANRMIKYNLSTAMGGEPCGETAFGVSSYKNNKIGDEVVQPNNPQTLGKIKKVSHLIEVTEA